MAILDDMMNFGLSDDHKMVRQTTRDFAEKELGPYVEELEEKGEYPIAAAGKLGELGMLGVTIDPKYGGAGMDYLSYGIICEEIARVDWVTASIVSVQNSLVNSVINSFGTEEQKQRFLVPLASGQRFAAAGLTEPRGGSDLVNLVTRATPTGDGYVLNGSKIFISHASFADVYFVLATINPELKHRGITAFVMFRDTPGITVRTVPMRTLHRDNIGEIIFEEVKLGKDAVLGEEGRGFRVVGQALDNGRYSVAARGVGGGQACIEASVKYANERVIGGQPIANYQLVQAKIADMVSSVQAARLLVYQLGRMKDAHAPRTSLEASITKKFATDAAFKCAVEAVEIHGGYGLAAEFPVGRYVLEAKALQTIEGTNDVHTTLIAEYALGIRKY